MRKKEKKRTKKRKLEVETINARMKIPTFLDPDNLIQPIDASYHSLIAISLPLPRIPSHDKITGHRLETKRISTHLHALRIGFSRECQGPARPGARTTSREKSRRREKFPPRRISLALFQSSDISKSPIRLGSRVTWDHQFKPHHKYSIPNHVRKSIRSQ